MRRLLLAYAVLALAVLSAPPALGAYVDFRIVLEPGEAPVFAGDGVQGELVRNATGELLEWRLTTDKTHLKGIVTSSGYFEVEHRKQVVPEADAHFFFEVPGGVDDAAEWARIINITGPPSALTMRVAFPYNTTAGFSAFRLARDTEPPAGTVGEPRNVTQHTFYIETTTDEWAFADLKIRRAPDGEEIRNPTTALAMLQRFPIVGLDTDTDYVYYVDFWDWAGNTARSPEYGLRTAPAPDVAGPVVTARFPEADAVLDAAVTEITANFTAGAGEVRPDADVRLFVDKHEVTQLAVKTADGVRYVPPEPLGAGLHSVGLELTNTAGGKTVATWTFRVGASPTPGPGPVAAIGALVAAVVVLGVRRRM